jgi:uncharacterized protein YcaQ
VTAVRIDVLGARRLALARAGLLKTEWTGLPDKAGRHPRRAAHQVIAGFGYLQLDSVSVSGARSHTLVLLSRLEGLDPKLAEDLLQRGEPLFEYWGHEASWLPIDLYPAFEFRRQAFQKHPWWGDLIGGHPQIADGILERIAKDGPLRSADLEGQHGGGWWRHKLSKKVAEALWSAGRLAIAERKNFQRTYDLPERVLPEPLRAVGMTLAESLELLLLRAVAGHGWATATTLGHTFRLRGLIQEVAAALQRLVDGGRLLRCELVLEKRRIAGYVRPEDLELAERLRSIRLRRDRGVLLSPFDPVLWDRARVAQLFGFEQFIEIYKKPHQRIFGYYCLPVLAGDRLVARVDLKADRKQGTLRVVSRHFELKPAPAADLSAVQAAVDRHAAALGLTVAD